MNLGDLDPGVAAALAAVGVRHEVLACDPDYADTTRQLTGMMIGGVTPFGVTTAPPYLDAAVVRQPRVVMGGGNRSSKVLLDPQELLKLPGVRVVEGLATAAP